MRFACLVLLLSGAPALAEGGKEAIASFHVGETSLAVHVGDVVDASAQFGDDGAGLAVLFSEEFGHRLLAFTQGAIGKEMRFTICGDEMIRATVQAEVDRRISISVGGLGTAVWYEAFLTGDWNCDD